MVQVLALFVPCVLKPPAPAPRRAFEFAKQNRSSRRAWISPGKAKASFAWSRKQSQGSRRALGETVWQQNPNSRRYFWESESSHRVKAADSALGAKSQIKVADVVLGLRDISVREVATVTPFAINVAHSLGFAWRGPF